ncbi:MAG: hypothetical protein H6602_11490 [Flavobacteriales bacterium]|nr:hypothetical protein [Flavobacteriales bacterium]
MKKVLYCLYLNFLAVTLTQAQDYKGSVFTGGNLNASGYFDSNDQNEYENFSFSIIPNVGGFVSNSFAIGGTASYRWSERNNNNSYNDDSSHQVGNTIGASVYARYYKFFSQKFALMSTADVGYAYTHSKLERKNNGEVLNSISDQHAIETYITPGLVYFITPKFGLEASFGRLGYMYRQNHSRSEIEGVGTTSSSSQNSSFNIDFNITSLQIGLMYYFGGKSPE